MKDWLEEFDKKKRLKSQRRAALKNASELKRIKALRKITSQFDQRLLALTTHTPQT